MRFTCVVLACCGLLAPAHVSAQTAQKMGQSFSALAATGTSIDVIEDTGKETHGRLRRFDADSLTIDSQGRERTFDRQHISRIYQRGDSLKNGLFIGLGIGAGLGIAAALTTECGGFFERARSCTAGEKAQLASLLGGTAGALGMGIGLGIDALFTHRRLLYEARPRGDGASIFVAPRVMPSGTGLLVTVAW